MIPSSLLRNSITVTPVVATGTGLVDGLPYVLKCHVQPYEVNDPLGSPAGGIRFWTTPSTMLNVGDKVTQDGSEYHQVEKITTRYSPTGTRLYCEVLAR